MTIQQPSPGDSNSILIWKYATNMWILSSQLTQQPKVGSSDNLLFVSALKSVQSLT